MTPLPEVDRRECRDVVSMRGREPRKRRRRGYGFRIRMPSAMHPRAHCRTCIGALARWVSEQEDVTKTLTMCVVIVSLVPGAASAVDWTGVGKTEAEHVLLDRDSLHLDRGVLKARAIHSYAEERTLKGRFLSVPLQGHRLRGGLHRAGVRRAAAQAAAWSFLHCGWVTTGQRPAGKLAAMPRTSHPGRTPSAGEAPA